MNVISFEQVFGYKVLNLHFHLMMVLDEKNTKVTQFILRVTQMPEPNFITIHLILLLPPWLLAVVRRHVVCRLEVYSF